MRVLLLLASYAASAAQKQCHAVSAAVSDDWCNSNCNHSPPNCPADLCDCGSGPSPTPSPGPTPPAPSPPPAPPAPTPLPDNIVGYYAWSWGGGSSGPAGANLGVPFTGLIDVDQAISQSPSVRGIKFLSLGGGNAAGEFTASTLGAITAKASNIKSAGFEGVMYDVEEVVGPSSSMSPLFAESFAAMRNAGLLVGVTTSHSAPYACDTPQDATDILRAWCADPNIDVISPQLYSSGMESEPELVPTNFCKDAGCTWDIYTSCKAAIAPSIVRSSHYAASQSFFKSSVGRDLRGYIVWAQNGGDVTV